MELQHHGVKGMKWGVRRYRKPDGSLTPAGKKRYSSGDSLAKQMLSATVPKDKAAFVDAFEGRRHGKKMSQEDVAAMRKQKQDAKDSDEKRGMSTGKKVAIGAVAVGATAAAGYLAYKIGPKVYDKVVDDLAFTNQSRKGEKFYNLWKDRGVDDWQYAFDEHYNRYRDMSKADKAKSAKEYIKSTKLLSYKSDRKAAKEGLLNRANQLGDFIKNRPSDLWQQTIYDTASKNWNYRNYDVGKHGNELGKLYADKYVRKRFRAPKPYRGR